MFSQSLHNVQWRFLREDQRAAHASMDLSMPLTGGSSHYSPRQSARNSASPRQQYSPRGSTGFSSYSGGVGGGDGDGGGGGDSVILSAGSEVLRQVPPQMGGSSLGELAAGSGFRRGANEDSGGSGVDGGTGGRTSSTLSQVRELQEALSQNDFPSKVFRYLSVGVEEDSNWSNRSGIGGGGGGGGSISDGGGSSVDYGGRGNALSGVSVSGFSPDAVQREMDRLSASIHGQTASSGVSANLISTSPVTTSGSGSVLPEDKDSILTNRDGSDEDDSDDEEDSNRPDSPIIIWRPSARVQIADDLPPELVAELLGHPSPSSTNGGKNAAPSSPRSPRSPRLGGGGGGGDHAWNSGRGKGKPSFLKKDYGAWYLRPKEWNKSMTGELKNAYEKAQQVRVGGTNSEVDRVIEEKSAELNQILPKLFISNAYREWLEKQDREHPEHALPMPHYLKKKKFRSMSKKKSLVGGRSSRKK
jgi:hypothetical protein